MQYSREAKWTPGCSGGSKDTVYQRRTLENRQEDDWQEEMLIVHCPIFILLALCACVLEFYCYFKSEGKMCFPPWVVHVVRAFAIAVSGALLFYSCGIVYNIYEEYQYYDNVISESCTDGEYEPPFFTMRDSLEKMYNWDLFVLVFDFLVFLWFCLLLCCVSVKIGKSWDPEAWSCWNADLPEYQSAKNGLSYEVFDWEAALPNQVLCPCTNTYVSCFGCQCRVCSASPEGARIDLDVMGARRRMYQKDVGEDEWEDGEDLYSSRGHDEAEDFEIAV